MPRLRTCTSAIWLQTSPRIGRARASAGVDDVGVGRHRAELERAVGAELDTARNSPMSGQVDEDVGRRRTRLHDVDQRLAAGECTSTVVGAERRRAS